MNEEFWKQFEPIPGFDCVKMKHEIQAKIYEKTRHMTLDERLEYYRRGAEEFRQIGRISARKNEALEVKEKPPKYGDT